MIEDWQDIAMMRRNNDEQCLADHLRLYGHRAHHYEDLWRHCMDSRSTLMTGNIAKAKADEFPSLGELPQAFPRCRREFFRYV